MARKGFNATLPEPDGVNRRWHFVYRKQRNYGCIDWNTRTIHLAIGQTDAELCDTICHETRHVADGTGKGSDEGLERVIERAAAGATAALLGAGLIGMDPEDE